LETVAVGGGGIDECSEKRGIGAVADEEKSEVDRVGVAVLLLSRMVDVEGEKVKGERLSVDE
jgi:hypothetical protein